MSIFSIHAVEAIFSSCGKLKPLKKFLQSVENMHNLFVYSTTIEEGKQILKLSQITGFDFDDVLWLFVAKSTSCTIIVSFDRHFDKSSLMVPDSFGI